MLLATVPVLLPAAFQADAADIDHGRYLFDAAGCLGCHTDKENKGAPLAGGRRFETPFGVYYSPNITPDRMTGIGNWSMADFLRALRYGENPDGENYFPVFPYTSYTKMSDGDILDLKAYIFSLAPVRQPNLEHEAGRVFGSRFMVGPWKVINFRAGPMKPVPDRGKKWNRGAYLVEALGHCGECHTPRDRLGGTLEHQHMAGTAKGPGGEAIPNITPDQETGIGKWPDADLKALFSIGMLPDGDFVSGGMAENVSNTTGKWSKADAEAVIEYLKSLPPVINKIKKDKKKKTGTDEWN
ncbi:MAG: cytochrome c [Rhodospirillaceae bacterium]|nr:cytochrome c [Rhodospirillaceae bacterium]